MSLATCLYRKVNLGSRTNNGVYISNIGLFDCQGKAVLIYNEKNQNPTPEHPEITEPFKINFNKCTFTAHAKATSSEGKTYGAIEIDSSISSPFNITITDCTSTGFSYDSAIYHVKKHKYNVSIVIDSNSVYNE